MHTILIGGLWMDASCWDQVISHLDDATAVALPGQGDGNSDATLDDQVAAIVAAIDAVDGEVVVVGHSAASSLAWIATDRRPDKVAMVALIGGFPAGDGSTYADFFEPVDGVVPFPGWEPFEGPDSGDLSADQRRSIAANAVPVPAAVTKGTVTLQDARRYDVPILMVCPEYSPDDVREWLAAGDLPELAKAHTVEYADIDSGHWPMFTKPAELAAILQDAATGR